MHLVSNVNQIFKHPTKLGLIYPKSILILSDFSIYTVLERHSVFLPQFQYGANLNYFLWYKHAFR